MKLKFTASAAFLVAVSCSILPADAATINIPSQTLNAGVGFTYTGAGSGPLNVGTGAFATQFPGPNAAFPQYGFLANGNAATSGTVPSNVLLPDNQIQSVVYTGTYALGASTAGNTNFIAFARAVDNSNNVLASIELFNISSNVASSDSKTKDITSFISTSRTTTGFAGFNLSYELFGGTADAGFNQTVLTITPVPEPSEFLGLLGFGMTLVTGRIVKFKRSLSRAS